MYVIPLTLMIIIVLLYLNFRNITEVAIIMATLPLAVVGSIWLLYLLNYNFSVAVGVGFIALAGVSTELSVIMLVFLNMCWKEQKERAQADGRRFNIDDLKSAILEGGALRVRPKAMTAAAIIGGLLPVMFGTGTGSEIMGRIAAPMVGGMISALLLTLLVLPVVYFLWKKREL